MTVGQFDSVAVNANAVVHITQGLEVAQGIVLVFVTKLSAVSQPQGRVKGALEVI